MNHRNLLLSGALVAAIAAPLMSRADEFYLTAKGAKQGDLQGGVTMKGHENSMRVLKVDYSVISPRDPQSGLPTGKRMHKPITVIIEIDKATPLLFNSAVTNETLSTLDIQAWRPALKASSGVGTEEKFLTIHLDNASVASFRMLTEDGASAGATRTLKGGTLYVEVSFTFQKITITEGAKGTTGMDDWSSKG